VGVDFHRGALTEAAVQQVAGEMEAVSEVGENIHLLVAAEDVAGGAVKCPSCRHQAMNMDVAVVQDILVSIHILCKVEVAIIGLKICKHSIYPLTF
jgi:hypothetical protein